MARRVVWTQSAWADLEAIADHIARDSPRYAGAFVREIRDAGRSLARLGERGRLVPEFNVPSIRELFVRNYRLVYRLTEKNAEVIGFVHGARDLWLAWQEAKKPPR